MPSTPFKGYTIPATSSEVGTWGTDINTNFTGIVDNNMAGIVTKTLAGSNIALAGTDLQMATVRLIGTISTNIQVTSTNQGFYFVENLTTGAFTVTVTNGVSGVTIPQGTRATLYADTTNGVRIFGADGFATGTVIIFQQTSAPTGWTKVTTNTDKALRITSGSASTGGTLAFSTAFAAGRTLTGSTASYVLQVADIPSHNHTVSYCPGGAAGGSGAGQLWRLDNTTSATFPATGGTIAATGGGGGHLHGAGTLAVAMDVQYVDVIAASKAA